MLNKNALFKLCLVLVVLLILIPQYKGNAQEEPIRFQSIQIELWPEYDRREILVIYRIVLASNVQLPVEMILRIPAGGSINATAVRSMTGDLFSIPNNREVRGEWALITFTATEPELQIEYYDPGLVINGKNRSFLYRWTGDYAVDQVTLKVQQPLDENENVVAPVNVETSPNLAGLTQDSGLVYHSANVGSLGVGENFDLNLSYLKNSSKLTVDFLSLEPSEPITPETPGRVDVMDLLPWGLGALGVIVIFAGLFWYWSTGRNQPAAEPPRKRRSSQRQVAGEFDNDIPEAGVYCHQCGKRAGPGDRFCRACGTRLRKSEK